MARSWSDLRAELVAAGKLDEDRITEIRLAMEMPGQAAATREYPCPECGYDGPHTVVARDDDTLTMECAACMAEFQVPPEGRDEGAPDHHAAAEIRDRLEVEAREAEAAQETATIPFAQEHAELVTDLAGTLRLRDGLAQILGLPTSDLPASDPRADAEERGEVAPTPGQRARLGQGQPPLLEERDDGTLVVTCRACGQIHETIPAHDQERLGFWRDPQVTLVCAARLRPEEIPAHIFRVQARFHATVWHWGYRPAPAGRDVGPPAGFEPADTD